VVFYILHSRFKPPIVRDLSTNLSSDLPIKQNSELKENKLEGQGSRQDRLSLQAVGGLKVVGTLFLSTTLFITLSLYFFINKIEGYTQNAAIEFYKSLEGKNVYIKNVGFKSYAPLFYSKKPSGQKPESKKLHWLLSDEVDKDVYFVTRIQDEERFQKYPSIKEISRKNGFVFFKKDKK